MYAIRSYYEFTAAGTGVDLARLRRAVALSLDKYCSVVATLAPDTTVTCVITSYSIHYTKLYDDVAITHEAPNYRVERSG